MWKYIHIDSRDTMLLSGWKIYIYGDSLQDSILLEGLITGFCTKWDITCKLATQSIINRNIKLKPAWGIGVIYLIPNINIQQFIQELNICLASYNKSGYYNGSLPITNKLSIRYDLGISITNIIYEEYINYYRGEFGPFNISNNPIPIQLIDYQYDTFLSIK